jgi:hypothetical protein
MPEPSTPDQPESPSPRPKRRTPAPQGNSRGPRRQPNEPQTFRDKLKHDPFLFALCLGFLAFTTWALAVTWRLLGDPALLALAVFSVVPAFYLFYLRDSQTT